MALALMLDGFIKIFLSTGNNIFQSDLYRVKRMVVKMILSHVLLFQYLCYRVFPSNLFYSNVLVCCSSMILDQSHRSAYFG